MGCIPALSEEAGPLAVELPKHFVRRDLSSCGHRLAVNQLPLNVTTQTSVALGVALLFSTGGLAALGSLYKEEISNESEHTGQKEFERIRDLPTVVTQIGFFSCLVEGLTC